MIDLDSIDKKILEHLQDNADESVERLGEQIGLSRNACWNRIKKLEENGVIQRKVVIVNPKAVNLGLTVFISVKTDEHDTSWLERFARVTRTLPEVQGVYRTAGELDYIIQARVPDVEAYDSLYRRLINQVRGMDVSASFVMQEIKSTTALTLNYT